MHTILFLLFIIITFGLSGIEKITEWKGQIEWLKGHFSKTIFKNCVPLLLATITIIEVLASVFAIIGIYEVCTKTDLIFAEWGHILAAVALLMLMVGQRLAKDYEGSATLAIYFGVCLMGLVTIGL